MADEREMNPYESPQSDDALDSMPDGDGNVAWREGNLAVVRTGRYLPPRCVHCNDDAEMVRGFYGVTLTFDGGFRRVGTAYWRCRTHQRRRWIPWLVNVPVVVVLYMVGTLYGRWLGTLPLWSTLLLVQFPLAALHHTDWYGRALTIWGRSGGLTVVKGCGSAFLDSLPTRDEVVPG